jgi:hypothetical protein
MNEIGGYFSLELQKNSNGFHKNGLFLNTGRNAFEFILKSLSRVNKIWIPFYTCDVILEPLIRHSIPYDFYHINKDLEIDGNIHLGENEYLLYTNYFGLKDSYSKKLKEKYKDLLIIDNAQALFSPPKPNSFYSPRKFIGMPDGGIAYLYNPNYDRIEEKDISYDRCSHLLKRYDCNASEGYEDFKQVSMRLCNLPVQLMSDLSRAIFDNVNFEHVKERRLNNFWYLHQHLAKYNQLKISNSDFECPMVYPFLFKDANLRESLIKDKIYIATYWPNVTGWVDSRSVEKYLTDFLLPLPIDQRYDVEDMRRIVNFILKFIA